MMKKRDPPNKSLLKIAVFTLQQKCQCNQLLDLTQLGQQWMEENWFGCCSIFVCKKNAKKITIKKQDASTES
jgi:hypothetical protein